MVNKDVHIRHAARDTTAKRYTTRCSHKPGAWRLLVDNARPSRAGRYQIILPVNRGTCVRVNNLPRVAPKSAVAGSRTCDLLSVEGPDDWATKPHTRDPKLAPPRMHPRGMGTQKSSSFFHLQSHPENFVEISPYRASYSGWSRPVNFPYPAQDWLGDHFVVRSSAVGQPTWPTQPSIPQGSVNDPCY